MRSGMAWWPLGMAVGVGLAFGVGLRREPPHPAASLDAPAGAQAAPPTQSQDLQKLQGTYTAIARAVTPGVVNITSQQIIPGRVLRDPFSNMFSDDFFGGGGGMMQVPAQKKQSLGSGVIVDGRGIIVTNHHVINNATTITVTLSDRRRFPARLLGSDPASDVAVLKIQAAQLPVLQWADSSRLQVGDIVLAIGSPFNLSSTVTQGIISAKGRRDLGISDFEDFLQTDAAINPGNSGGALVDIKGNVVGINSAILSESGGNQGIGLAIPSNLARKISNQLLAGGRVTRGWLGLVVETLTDDVATALKVPEARGVVVTGVYDNGPAAQLAWSRAGGDVIQQVNGVDVDSPGQLRNLVADLKPGATATLQVWQGGRTNQFSLTISRRPDRAQGV